MGVRTNGGYGRSENLTPELVRFALGIEHPVIMPSAEQYGSYDNVQKMTLDCIQALKNAKAIEESTIKLAA